MTWDNIVELAFGVLRIDPAVFWFRLSLRDWILTQRGFSIEQERQYRQTWEQTRMISYYSIRGMARGNLEFTDIARFPWEREEVEPITEEQLRYMLGKFGRNYDEKENRFYN